eukprot:CAMPEP_0114667556 /NCGR_PEP_ID=MMETSP0191-20121206/34681_1 /TAXON_ID=126664 /ORGANISM="Sorites sp." /LENGTH=136 /DNA_ID=CAMNT_0001918327 /DNA_START=527 /DNA_END=934 /DNA_ORIENTATION=+
MRVWFKDGDQAVFFDVINAEGNANSKPGSPRRNTKTPKLSINGSNDGRSNNNSNNIARDFIDDTENYDDLIQMVKQDITLDNDDDDDNDDIDDDDTVGDDTVGDTDNKTEDPLDLGSPRDDDIDNEYIEYYIKELK